MLQRMRFQRFALVVGLVVLAVGCASVSPSRAVMNTLETIKATAVSTMTTIGSLYQQGQVNEAQKAESELVYNRLQAGVKAVAAGVGTVTTIEQGTALTAPLQTLLQQLQALLASYQVGGAK